MSDRVYASATQHLHLCQHITYLLNSPQHPISTSCRLFLLDFILDIRPSPENRLHRLDVRTYHVLRRILYQMCEEIDIGQRHFFQDVLRLTISCHCERLRSRLRQWGSGTMPHVRESYRIPSRSGADARNNFIRCHRCREFGMVLSGVP